MHKNVRQSAKKIPTHRTEFASSLAVLLRTPGAVRNLLVEVLALVATDLDETDMSSIRSANALIGAFFAAAIHREVIEENEHTSDNVGNYASALSEIKGNHSTFATLADRLFACTAKGIDPETLEAMILSALNDTGYEQHGELASMCAQSMATIGGAR